MVVIMGWEMGDMVTSCLKYTKYQLYKMHKFWRSNIQQGNYFNIIVLYTWNLLER